MSDYHRLYTSSARTVGELIEKLKKLPLSTPIEAAGADIGGYDISSQPYVSIEYKDDTLYLSHHEYEAYELKKSGRLSIGQAKEFGA